MKHIKISLVLLCTIINVQQIHLKLTKPENFFGSEALMDGYCDEAQTFIDAFTLSSGRITVEGSADDVMRQLAAVNTTGLACVREWLNKM